MLIRFNCKRHFLIITLALIFISASAQRKMEELNTGVVAVKTSSGVFISWRLLGDELIGVEFNLYRDGIKVNTSPISESTNYTDPNGLVTSTYVVKKVVDGVETVASASTTVWANQYRDIPVRTIDGGYDTYEINDASVGDLDGDGTYEIVVKRLALDMTIESTDYHYLEAYELDGTFLWAINLGPNICNKVEVNFLVYDFDEDGKAEIATRTSDGMIDGLGNNIGDRDGDGQINYRSTMVYNSSYYRIDGPDYISIFDGETGEELVWDNYINREPLTQWGPPGLNDAQLGHRATKCMWTVAYLDGKHPSIVNSRGIYERIKLEAWDYNGTTLTKRWSFDSDPGGVPSEYHGQGNHNLSLADVDQDGKDEIVYASMVVDDDGTGLYSTLLGHGDALHVADMNPDRPGLEIWGCHEPSSSAGATFRDAKTGEILIQYLSGRDCGRAAAGDISAKHKGYELWGALSCPMYSCNGDVVGANNVPMNFMIWWDGDLLREFCDHNWLGTTIGAGVGTISKYNESSSFTNLLTATGTYSNNYTKGTPTLQADILGDWREEIIWRSTDNSMMRLYTTIYPSDQRIPTLMHDPQYRIAVAWQNNSYNQPPHVGFYLAAEMDDVVPYPISNNKVIWNTGTNWDLNTSLNWKDDNENSVAFQNGDDILFDLTGNNSTPINILENVSPRSLTVTSNTNYEIEGVGKLTSDMTLYKGGTGALYLNNTNDYTGITKVLYGDLVLNGELSNSKVEVSMFGTLYANGNFGNDVLIKTDAEMYIGEEKNTSGSTEIIGDLYFQDNAELYIDLSDDTSNTTHPFDKILINGNLIIEGKTTINIGLLSDSLSVGRYELIKYKGDFVGSIDSITIAGISGIPFNLEKTDSSIVLNKLQRRKNSTIKWIGGFNNNVWDLTLTKNFNLNGQSVWFIENDSVIFNDEGLSNTTINLSEDLSTGNVEINSSLNYVFQGTGSISGTGGLNKTGSGKLSITNTNNYTGQTVINQGNIEIESLSNAGVPGALGAASNSGNNLVMNGGTLSLTNANSSTDRNLLLQSNGGTIYLNYNKELIYNGVLTGDGKFKKTGNGKLILNNANTHNGGITLSGGELFLGSAAAIISGCGSGPYTLESGTLSMLEGVSSSVPWDIIVPKSANATIKLVSGNYTGILSGSGVLNIYTPGNKSELLGDWSQFEGQINASADDNGGWLILGNKSGYGKTSINLGSSVVALYRHTANDTIEIGTLTGDPGARLGAGGEGEATITWKIGGSGSSFDFNGKITELQYAGTRATTAIIKTGQGNMTLSQANEYSKGTTIEQGKLTVTNKTGSATGTGNVKVLNGGSLSGNGFIQGETTVFEGGVISPGVSGPGILTISSNINFLPESNFMIDINTETLESDLLVTNDTVNLDGILYMLLSETNVLVEGDSIKIIEAPNCTGEFSRFIPRDPGNNLEWDTTTLCEDGYLRVKIEGDDITQNRTTPQKENNLLKIYPNPAFGNINITSPLLTESVNIKILSMNGLIVFSREYTNHETAINLDISDLNKGVYILKIESDTNVQTQNLIIP